MPVSVEWLDDAQTILLCKLRGEWDWKAVHDGIDRLKRLAAAVPRAYVVMDVSEAGPLPQDALRYFANVQAALGENVHCVMLVGTHPLVRVLFEVMSRVRRNHNRRVFLMESLSSAVNRIAAQQTSGKPA